MNNRNNGDSIPSVSELLVKRIGQIQAAPLEEFAVSSKLRLLDGLAVMVSGSTTPIAALARDYLGLASRGTAGSPGFGVLPASDVTLSLEDAGFLAGVYGFAENYADTSLQSVAHPGSVVIPAALVASQSRATSGAQLLRAIAAGYEVMEVLARAINNGEPRMGSQLKGFRPTASCGAFGVVAVMSSLWELPPHDTRNALGVAADYGGGLRRHVRDDRAAIRSHSGETVRGGLTATLLAASGLVSHPDVFEAEGGFFSAYGAEALDTGELERLHGEPSWYVRNSCLKQHCGPHTLMTALDILLQLRKEVRLADVEVIHVRVPATHTVISGKQAMFPSSAAEAAASYEYAAAVVLSTGEPLWPEALHQHLDASEVQRLFHLVDVQPDHQLTEQFAEDPESWPAQVQIVHRQGDAISGALNRPVASGSTPAIYAIAESKLRHCFRTAGFGHAAEPIIETVDAVEDMENVYASLETSFGQRLVRT